MKINDVDIEELLNIKLMERSIQPPKPIVIKQSVPFLSGSYDFSKIINDDNILNDSINCIKKLIDSKMFEISFLTHVNSLTEGCVKVEYLRRHFKDITIIMVPKEISKTKVVHSEGAILVDDYSGNLKEWEENGGISVRFSKELESHGYRVLNHLDELINMFKNEVNEC